MSHNPNKNLSPEQIKKFGQDLKDYYQKQKGLK